MLMSILKSIFVVITGLFILFFLFVLGVYISDDITLITCIFLAYFGVRYLIFIWNFWSKRWWFIHTIICIFLLILFAAILGVSLDELPMIYQEYLIGFFMLFLLLRLVPFAINYRKQHPYKPLLGKEEWQMVWFICLYKILTGKKR